MKGLYFEKDLKLSNMVLRCSDLQGNILAVGSHSKEVFLLDLEDKS
jgi:hypothetical protein